MTFQSADMRGLRRRRLHYALAASLLFHLLLLWPTPARPPNREASALLQATMRQPPPAKAAPSVPEPRAAVAPPAPARIAPAPEPPASTKLLESPASVSVPQTTAAPVEAAARAASGPALPSAANPRAVAEVSPLTQATATGEALDGLRGYRLAVAGQARRFKRYPAQAMALGWAGTAEIRLEVGRDGQPRPATVLRSSGHELLDRAALEMIDAGALRARLPESLRGRNFAVLLPVVFNLEEE